MCYSDVVLHLEVRSILMWDIKIRIFKYSVFVTHIYGTVFVLHPEPSTYYDIILTVMLYCILSLIPIMT